MRLLWWMAGVGMMTHMIGAAALFACCALLDYGPYMTVWFFGAGAYLLWRACVYSRALAEIEREES